MRVELFNGYRGSGRTTIMLSQLVQYAIEHPDHKIMVFTHNSMFAKTLKSWYRQMGMDTNNIAFNVIPEDIGRVNERVFDKYFIDHCAEELYWQRLVSRTKYDFERVFG
jgi:hypothetical protein